MGRISTYRGRRVGVRSYTRSAPERPPLASEVTPGRYAVSADHVLHGRLYLSLSPEGSRWVSDAGAADRFQDRLQAEQLARVFEGSVRELA